MHNPAANLKPLTLSYLSVESVFVFFCIMNRSKITVNPCFSVNSQSCSLHAVFLTQL